MKISLRRRHALTVADGAFIHKIDYVTILKENLNPTGHPNRITGSKVTAILLNGWILSIGGASSGRVCSCSLRSRLVLIYKLLIIYFLKQKLWYLSTTCIKKQNVTHTTKNNYHRRRNFLIMDRRRRKKQEQILFLYCWLFCL